MIYDSVIAANNLKEKMTNSKTTKFLGTAKAGDLELNCYGTQFGTEFDISSVTITGNLSNLISIMDASTIGKMEEQLQDMYAHETSCNTYDRQFQSVFGN
jgi:hypothetical protein